MQLIPTFIRNSLIKKLAISTALTIFILGFLATYFVYNKVTQVLQNQAYSDTQNTALIFADRMNRRFVISHSLITNLANLPLIQTYYQKQNPIIQDKNVLARLQEENYDQNFSAIYLMDSSGNTLVSTDPSFINQNYAFRPYFQGAIKGEKSLDIAIGKTSKQLGFYLASPIIIKNAVVGVVVGKLKPEPVLRLLETKSLENVTTIHHIHLIDETGTIIVSTDSTMLFAQLASLSSNPELSNLATKRYAQTFFTNLGYNQTLQALFNHNYTVINQTKNHLSDHSRLLTLTPVLETPFHVLVETEFEPIRQSVNQISQVIGIIILGAAIFAIIIINISLYKIISPITQLTQSALAVANGQTNLNIDLNRADEIGQLSNAFSKMTNKLLDNQKNIEAKVKERTEELTRLNNSMVDRELKMIDLKNQIKTLTQK